MQKFPAENYLMPITDFLDDSTLDPETRRIMGVAFEMVRAAFQFRDRDRIPDAVIARKIMELAKAGETNPDQLCEQALKLFSSNRVPGKFQLIDPPARTMLP
jgi:hypothetical protein